MSRILLAVLVTIPAIAYLSVGPLLAADDSVDFNRDIRPILSDTCFACHGPDEGQRQANLRLDIRDGAFADRGEYQLILKGDSGGSRLYQRVSHRLEALRMPPPYFERSLTTDQIELIRRWIDEGARWEIHWAFEPPAEKARPKVQNKEWPINDIDYFVLARLESEGLEPSPPADKATLLRRLTLDLTGLPPTLTEIDAFLADDSPQAYEHAVDRILSSAHYGERMAIQWLDLARYADSNGYHIDNLRDMWPWRDWVINAFNRNMPFDQFTVEQLAGDLLPDASVAQKVATGFSRNHMINFEGGAVPEEYQTEYVVDRVETTATVWLGLTMGCARCHDHKYDPIKQKEFYQFFAFFNTVPERGLDGRKGNSKPFVHLPSRQQEERLAALERKTAAIEQALPEAEIQSLIDDWKKIALPTIPAASREGLLSHYEFDGDVADSVSQAV